MIMLFKMKLITIWMIAVCIPLQSFGEVSDPFLLSANVESGLNDQILAEYEAFYIYEHMASYFSRPNVGLSGFANFFRKSANEEIEHARKFSEFVNKRNSKVILKNIILPSEGVPMDFKNIHEAIDLAIDKELYVSTQINELHKLAAKMNDATVNSRLLG
ncbi:unnamed protein product [Heterobilharzia americana]|nr:unnamed protein product [Heterobilharzia americana]